MQPHLRPELERFRPWLGHWRGPGTDHAGRAVLVECSFAPVLEGLALEVTSGAMDKETGACLSRGVGLWGIDSGKVAAAIFTAELGAVIMREIPDDPAGVCIEAMISGGIRFTVALVPDGDTLTLTSRRREGYHGASRPLTFGLMRRVAPAGVRS